MHCVPIFATFGLNQNLLYRYKMILKLFCDNFSHSFRYSYMYHSVLLSTSDNVPVLQFIVDIFEILKYSNNR